MQSSVEKLYNLLRLEHQQGYANRAVIGGFESFLDFWVSEARNEKLPENAIQAVAAAFRSYASQTPEERADTLKNLWKKIQGEIPEAVIVRKKSSLKPQVAQARSDGEPPEKESARVPSVPVGAPIKNEIQKSSLPQKEKTKETVRHPVASPAIRKPGRAESHPGGVTSKRPIALNASLTVLAGVGPKNAIMLSRLGLNNLGDVLYFFPRRYDDYSLLKPIRDVLYGEQLTIIGTVTMIDSRRARTGKMTIQEAVINDGTAGLRLTWFNMPWLTNLIHINDAISVSGRVDQYLGRLVMKSPEWEPVETESLHTNGIVPIYPLTARVHQKWLRTLIQGVVNYWAPRLTDHLPEAIQQSAGVLDIGSALLQIHKPASQEKLAEARQRLAFDEVFFLQTGVMRKRRDWQGLPGRVFDTPDVWLQERFEAMPFTLTAAQKKAVLDIRTDTSSGKPMNRLLQGDVGSGKTAVAALAAAMINRAGCQAAIMAPTSILAEQHYKSFTSLLAGSEKLLDPDEICLLVGSTPEKEKEGIRQKLASGKAKIAIGTHALLEDPVVFSDLQLVVVDEQHRFGVEQRALLRAKGTNPHLLVMTATPIPRSLALTLYGDLDLSVMDEMPPGRESIETHILAPMERERAYTLINSQVEAGHQAFVVYPLIEESDDNDMLAATQEYERIRNDVFPKLKVGLLHGRMKPDEKDAVMLAFRDNQYQVLVSTTVIEVGVDVPNATVMLVEGANHFGLAQLHQLRGRVGRGGSPAFCLLIPDHEEASENERLQAMTETNNGFLLAERDLQQRGPGEFLGTRQAGFATSLKMASLSDIVLIEKARDQAQALFSRDPDLAMPEDSLLAEALDRYWNTGKGDAS